jgi:hypothetical protein
LNDIKPLITTEEIETKLVELGAAISVDYAGQDLLLVGVLRGAFMVMADLARHIDLPVEFDFMAVSSYGASTQTSGVVRILKDLDEEIDGRHVLIVEDIIDSGLTLNYLIKRAVLKHVPPPGVVPTPNGHVIGDDVEQLTDPVLTEQCAQPLPARVTPDLGVDCRVIDNVVAVTTPL